MKKSIFLAFIAVISLLLTMPAHSQDVAYSKPIPGKKISPPNFQADKNFKKSFNNVFSQSWSKKEDGYRVRFNQNDIAFMVDYDKKGRWVSTIKVYNETNLDNRIAKIVQAGFLGYSIVQAMEIQTAKVKVHLVKIENKDFLKTIRIIDGEADLFEEYRRH